MGSQQIEVTHILSNRIQYTLSTACIYTPVSISLDHGFILLFAEETQFVDYRFVKDLELRAQPRCCCFCVSKELLIYADDKDSVSVRQSEAQVSPTVEHAPISILHPEAQKVEAIVRNAWADTKLVSD